MPDYEVKEWNETNSPLDNEYTQAAYQQKAWSRLSNYIRLHALYTEGGIYLDTDVELVRNMTPLQQHKCFIGFQQEDEDIDWVNTAILGAEPGHNFLRRSMELTLKKFEDERELYRSPAIATAVLREMGLRAYGLQEIGEVTIYPTEYFYPYPWFSRFSPDRITDNTYCIHHWAGSWLKAETHDIPATKKQKLLSFVPERIKNTFAWSFARKIRDEGSSSLTLRALLYRGQVLSGPFRGMRLKAAFGSVLDAKIIGTYELELQQVVNEFINRKPRIVYVIGAAEGYYAVGLARACAPVSVHAWEADFGARGLLERTALENGVAKDVRIRGKCTPQELLEQISEAYPDLIICDVEGAEIELFTDEIIAALGRTSFIIETHRRTETRAFVERFSKSFDVRLFYSMPRDTSTWPLPRWISCAEEFKHQLMDEGRVLSGTSETPWIVALPPDFRR